MCWSTRTLPRLGTRVRGADTAFPSQWFDAILTYQFYALLPTPSLILTIYCFPSFSFCSSFFHLLVVFVESLSCIWLFVTSWTAACQATLSFTTSNSCSLSRRCCLTIPLSLTPSPFAFNLPHHQGHFQWVDSLHQVAKVLELQLPILLIGRI